MAELLILLANRFRPREGWPAMLLTLVAVFCLPAVILGAEESLDSKGLLILTALAAFLTLRLVRSRASGRQTALVLTLLGAAFTLILVGRLLPPLSLIFRELGYLGQRLTLSGETSGASPAPFATTAGFVWQRLGSLGARFWWWSQTIGSGSPAGDPLAFELLGTALCWACGSLIVWHVYRRRTPLIGILPGGAIIAVAAFFRPGLALFYLLVYLFCTLWLTAACHLWTSRERWETTGTDYPGNLGAELVIVLAPGITLILLLAAFFPVIQPHQVREAFWRVMDEPWSRVERAAESIFGPIESGYPGPGGGYGPGGQLPRAHLLGGGPELSETIVMYVTTNDPAPPRPETKSSEVPEPAAPRRYWRSETLDTYTGRGWVNSPLEQRTTPADEPLLQEPPPGPDLVQQFELLDPAQGEIYAANAPLRFDQPVQSWWRAPGDLARLAGSANRYRVVSRPPEPTVAELRAAPELTPPERTERYLALPEGVPQRVLDLAQQVAGERETRYDQARALELFLRTYTYTLELDQPPTDQDIVDFFLFDLQEGYCDYYASAMVVMARAVGIPARLASGYAQGGYDHDRERWVVTEKDGHSWVEVYFDGIGWVEFEPTAGLPALDRPGGDPSGLSVPPKPPRAPGAQFPWGLVIVAGLLLALIVAVAWIWLPKPELDLAAAALVRDRHARLERWGARLGQPPRDGQTPHEYGAALGDSLRARGKSSRWPPARQAADQAPPEVEQLTETFVRAQYSPQPLNEGEGWRIRELWTRLRRHLRWLWLGRLVDW